MYTGVSVHGGKLTGTSYGGGGPGPVGPPSESAPGIICWNCGLSGHVKAMCRARIDGSSYLEASTASTPTPTGAEERVEGGSSDASKEPGCSHNAGNVPPASIKPATVTHVRGKVNGIELGIVIDTGSATTIISQSLLSKVGTPPMSHSQHQVVSATGDPLLVLGTLDVYIEVGTVAVTHPVIVCSNITHECIVGVDFLTLHGFDVKFSTKTLETMDASAPLLVEDSPAALRRVAICETATVPAYHEMIIPAKLLPRNNDESVLLCGLLEGRQDFATRSQLIVARTLVDGTSGLVPVRVANPTPYPITVYEATHVGGFCPLQEGCPSTNLSVNACLSTDLSCPPNNSRTESEKTQQDVIDLFQIGHLPDDQKTQLSSVLLVYQDVFSWYPGDIGSTSKVYHRIPTGDAGPSRQAPRRLPFHKQTEVRDHLEEMLTRGIIQPSCSPWAAPIVLVQKKDGSTRFCVDYRRFNSVTKKDDFPLPRVDDSLDALGESELFSTLDLTSGYWQVELDPADREKTASSYDTSGTVRV